MKTKSSSLVPIERITSKIFLLRGEKVLIDHDLAKLYGVEVKLLKRAVNRNIERFPEDFMFKLSKEEYASLRYQIGTLKRGQHSKYLPYAFTEQGVAMLSSVLNSERAVHINIMRAFVQMRKFLQSSDELAKKLNKLEKETRKKFAEQQGEIKLIFDAIKELMVEKEITISHTRLILTNVKVEVWNRDKGQCVKCGLKENLHYDHDLSFSKGGTSLTAANVRILCLKCNLSKSNKIISIPPIFLS